MKLKVKKFTVDAGRPIIFLSNKAAKFLNAKAGDRLEISYKGKSILAVIDIISGFLSEKEVSLSKDILNYISIKSGEEVEVKAVAATRSAQFIAKKMQGKKLNKEEIFSIIQDIVTNSLSEPEIAYFVSAVYEIGLDIKETIYLTEAIYKTGSVLKWGNDKIADKHSIGGIAGNRTSPIVVSICSAIGIKMPKTSSRAITSAAGTADVMEVVAKVDFSSENLKKIVNKSGACLAWGGSLGLAPADDKLIRVERLLNVDPESQLIASIIAKKLAVGSKYILIDIPYGLQAKVKNLIEAKKLKNKFIKVAKHFNLNLRVVLTNGREPIGNGIGPVLEMSDVLRVLKQSNSPKDLEQKSLFLSGQIIEMLGKAGKNSGEKLAEKILKSGLALKKFKEIIKSQGEKDAKLSPAKNRKDLLAAKSGLIKSINNKDINLLARTLGCPTDKKSGIYIYHHQGEQVNKGEKLLTFYAESKNKLKDALSLYQSLDTIKIG